MAPRSGSTDSSRRTSRRALLGSVGLAVVSSAAGCLGEFGSSDEVEALDASEYTDEDVVDAVDEHADPLDSLELDAPLDDVEPFAETLAEHPIVGMGEATHGTREFHLLRARLVRALVEDHGLRVVAIEENFSSVARVNEYVIGEADDVDADLGINDTEGVHDLLEWLRSYNEGHPLEDQVRFHGIDMDSAREPARALRGYFETVDPGFFQQVEPDLEPLFGDDPFPLAGIQDDDRRRSLIVRTFGAADVLRTRMERYRPSYSAAISERRYEIARHHVRVLEQAARLAHAELFEGTAAISSPASSEARDEAMADNVEWLREHAPGDQIVYWAHNGHVQNGYDTTTAPRMGSFLRERHGEDYYALATGFGWGSFRARPSPGRPWSTIERSEPVSGTADEVLVDVAYPRFVMDFESAMDDPVLADWLATIHEVHGVGSVVRGYTDNYYLSEAFDGLAFVRESTPT